MTRNLADHYDEAYYKPGWGGRTRSRREHERLAEFWRHAIFEAEGFDPEARVLDYGAGLGLISGHLPNCICYDASPYARKILRDEGRTVIDVIDDKNCATFDFILMSHVLEHVPEPHALLHNLRCLLEPRGRLLLLLPVESNPDSMFTMVDHNNHLYCWTPQTIGNLLAATGYEVERQKFTYGPYGLRFMEQRLGLGVHTAASIAYRLGRIRRNRPSKSIFTTATGREAS